MDPTAIRVEGEQLVIARSVTALPHCCLMCGEPADGPPMNHTFRWYSSWWLLLFFVCGMWLFLILLAVQKSHPLQIGLCAAHRTRRGRRMYGGYGGGLLGFVGSCVLFGFASGESSNSGLAMLGVALFGFAVSFALIIMASRAQRIVRPVRIDDVETRLRGVSLRLADAQLASVAATFG